MAKKIKTILFDLGGVYLNRGIWIFRERYLVGKYGIDDGLAKDSFLRHYKQYFSGKINEKEFWGRHLRDMNLDADWKVLREELLESFEPQKGMPDLINKLRKDYRVGLLSDQTKEWWPYLDKKYGISDNFDFVIISSLTGFHKPQPEIYKIAIENADCEAKKCLFIDDLEHNLVPARDLGIETLLFENPKQIKKDLENLGIK